MAARREDTIYAVSSGRGRAAIAVVRISGAGTRGAVIALAGRLPPPRQASLRRLRRPGTAEILDQGVVLWCPGPASYTGEDLAELQVHGGRAVIQGVLAAAATLPGLRPAEPGEFTRRALEAGRLDLVEVEGIADLIAADTEAQRRQALRQMSGATSRRLAGWREALIGCLARHEAALDFAEDGVADSAIAGVASELERLKSEIEVALADAGRGERMRDGLHVVIAGPPNVGKSTLLNRLAQREVAIVSERAGTTRDVIEVHLDLAGLPLTVSDTAGLRAAAADPVEREGMRRARERLDAADIVLWVASPDEEETPPPAIDSATLWILNKADLLADPGPALVRLPGTGRRLAISARTGAGIDALVAELTEMAAAQLGGGGEPIITRERHRRALAACAGHIGDALAGGAAGGEIVAEHLRLAARELGRVVGKVDVEDLLDVVFREFCIGK